MNITARELGIKARNEGRKCVAAWDREVIKIASETSDFVNVFKSWNDGWMDRNIEIANQMIK